MNVAVSYIPTHTLPKAHPNPLTIPTVLAAKGPSELLTLETCSGISRGKVSILANPRPNFVMGVSQKAGTVMLITNKDINTAKNTFLIIIFLLVIYSNYTL
jgi:hypothetical protein